ncbi:hypothetical protein [Methylocapsa palsarum]|uniref:Uncharacterized protein n=1 Tax=Methylocapsa palsarum TaxID=1612308 RepID=A0A1I4CZC3_9HYPH|nr:hypothetical protein [Methylocapsa palsarum]SFK85201.1 hypothetical protein SAMN05444581_1307 [Methylocapsa palsarum]
MSAADAIVVDNNPDFIVFPPGFKCSSNNVHATRFPITGTEAGVLDPAQRFMQVQALGQNRYLRDLNIGVSALYLLAAPSTPDEVREADASGDAELLASVESSLPV